ncbi:hypothetical protein [Actinophytocola sp.]|uniref:hypothetical protein n=1 Tax=Actinophytocola sp. TaxID=1872138 RepID=UPI002ED306F3
MTGWQPGDGGWNQNQPFGPDAQTNAYNSDPYANQGADPYGYGSQYGNDPTPYGADPYGGGYGQYPQYQQQQQQYPQQQYPPTSGFPVPGYGPPPPPPKRSKLPMVLSLIAIVIIVGAVVTIVLVNRPGDQPVAQNDPTSTSSKPDPSKTESTSPSTTPSTGGSDWIAIDNTKNSGLRYEVPPDWKTTETTYDSGLGVMFTGGAEYGTYECEGKPYIRTYLASGDVQGGESTDLELPKTLKDFAASFAKKGYGEDAQVDIPEPTEAEVDGKPAMKLTAKVKQNVTSPNCQAVDGEVALIGVQVQDEGQPKGVAMVVVVNDLSGGPADPKALDAALTQQILSTVKLG